MGQVGEYIDGKEYIASYIGGAKVQVTGHRSGHRSGYRSQATGQVTCFYAVVSCLTYFIWRRGYALVGQVGEYIDGKEYISHKMHLFIERMEVCCSRFVPATKCCCVKV